MKIGIVTDSTADLPPEFVAEYGIEVVPMQVLIDHHNLRDGIDITSSEFYQTLSDASPIPITSQPAPGAFTACYRKLLQRVDAILSIHIADSLSGTCRTAQLASEMFPGADIRVIDSRTTSMGLGGLVMETARAVRNGIGINQAAELVERLRQQINLLVFMDNLEFIRRSGRLTRLKAVVGSILNIKPILQLIDGDVEPVGQTRSRRDAVLRMLDEFRRRLDADTRALIAVMYTTTRDAAEVLQQRVQEIFPNAEVILGQAGPSLGIHVGPGAMGIISIPKERRS